MDYAFFMDLGKWLWRFVLTLVVIFMMIAGYRLSGILLKSQTLGPAILAQVSVLNGPTLELDQLVLDQDLLTVSTTHVDLLMTWDGLTASAQLVIDPRKLPPVLQAKTPYKWLVAIPKGATSEMKFCVSLPDQPSPECYRFSRSATVSESVSDIIPVNSQPSEPIDTVYPRPLVSIHPLDSDLMSLFVTVEPYSVSAKGTVNPRRLFLRINSLGKTTEDNQRLNGYPFQQIYLPKGSSVTLEFIDKSSAQEYVYAVLSIPELVDGAVPLVNAAPEPNEISTLDSLPSLRFKWLGTEKTSVDPLNHLAKDVSEAGRDFSTRVSVHSTFPDSVKILVQLQENSTTFSHTITPLGDGDVLINIKNLAYGKYSLQLNAILPDGQRTADVVIPFEYRASSWFE